jgi:hypothetical protein
MPQICDMGFTSLPKEGVLKIVFFVLKKSDWFGRV